ncbi:MAG: response regulator transcription factor [Deltaproteobacteria bacterium]|nr:response regulator transcription factor [Deltaproteobacteria bacterium]TLN01007.1 MAG: response regulator transcription factor [bacterium]
MKTLVMIVDDHQIVRDGLKAILHNEEGIGVIAEADNGRTALRLIKELMPEIVIMDIAMPDMNGIDATRRISVEYPDIKVLILSMHHDKRMVLEVFNAGARGYLLKECASDELLRAIKTLLQGETYLSPKISSIVVKGLVKQQKEEIPSEIFSLSSREREVLQLLAEGKSMKEIAFTLDVSIKTVEAFRKRLMDKLKVNSIAELTKIAIREGLTSLD